MRQITSTKSSDVPPSFRVARYGGIAAPDPAPPLPNGDIKYKADPTLPSFGWGPALTPKHMAPNNFDAKIDPETGEPELLIDAFGIVTKVHVREPKPGLALTGEGAVKSGPINLEGAPGAPGKEGEAGKGSGGVFKNTPDKKGPDVSQGEGDTELNNGKVKVDPGTRDALETMASVEEQ